MIRTGLGAVWVTPDGWLAKDGCTILDCGRPGIARGMCWFHYQRAMRGRPVYVYAKQAGRYLVAAHFGPKAPPYRERKLSGYRAALSRNVTEEPTTGCWLWTGRCFPSGYGALGTKRDAWGGYAHRAALYFQGVELERRNKRRHVRHLCDQPACVNPAHLVYGTALENVQDRERRYRSLGRRTIHLQEAA